ncbi:MAG: sigma-70 family RNA polymerase sigma factor [Rubrivivax sp.]|nr:sigma-70 family RNA polymerase sigma factor [Rubrivivax sp.]
MAVNAGCAPLLVEHAFRHLYGRLVARLSREFGFHRTESVEDAVQGALMAALTAWSRSGAPDSAMAWLYRVARNRLLDELGRSAQRDVSLHAETGDDGPPVPVADAALEPPKVRFEGEIADDELRLLFVCADEAIPLESQFVLALKILCGFSTREIALRLLTSEENVHKRLARGRERLRQLAPSLETPPLRALLVRRAAVMRIVYLLFNEGYSSALPERLIRRELCDEAIRLGHLLAEHPACGCAEADALLALMLLHAARFDARLDGHGGLLLLEEQDRSKWNPRLIAAGVQRLARAGRGEVFSRYHAEAAVAAAHCLAPSFEHTDWREIVELYETLERFEPSPLHTLNRAIALAQWQGPPAGLALLQALKPPAWLSGYYLWDATLGELERRAGDLDAARRHLRRALDAAPHPAERALIERRLAACDLARSGRP